VIVECGQEDFSIAPCSALKFGGTSCEELPFRNAQMQVSAARERRNWGTDFGDGFAFSFTMAWQHPHARFEGGRRAFG
jgi:hypothetical protein